MPDKKLINLPPATTPLDGTELYYAVQNNKDVKVTGSTIALQTDDIFVGSLSPPVLPNGSDQAAHLQAAIDSYSASGGASLVFAKGTYIFSSSIILKPNIVLRGQDIDLTTLKAGADNISVIGPWGAIGGNTGTAGIENLTVWGYADRNGFSQTTSKLINIGPFNYYWVRNVKAIYSTNMGITGFGGIGIVDNCVVNQCLRDGINLTGTTYVKITNNDISQVGDDAIAFHLANGTSGVNDNSVRVTGNRIEKSFGIKLLGARNAVVSENVIRFYSGYGINIGIDTSFGEGLITKFSISVTDNTILDGINANRFGAGTIGYGIFLLGSQSLGSGGTSIPVNVGQYLPGPHAIQTPDAFINKAGSAQPRGQDGNISIVGNDIRQTISGITNFSDAGFGLLWYNTGPVDIAISTLIGEVAGIGLHDDLENIVVGHNTMHGVGNGIETNSQLNNCSIDHNALFRFTGNGISMIAGAANNGSITIDSNLIDCDPYLESSRRISPIDGSWNAVDGSDHMGIILQNYNGIGIIRNRFRNCLRPVKFISGNYINRENIVEFDWTSANAGAGFSGISSISGLDAGADIFWFCNSNPVSGSFNQYDQNFVLSATSMPASGTWFKGTFVKNTDPTTGSLGWARLTSGSNNVAGADWATEYINFGTSGTDIGPALNTALANLAGSIGGAIGGQLVLAKGFFTTSVQIVLPNKVSLIGQGKRATIIQANNSFPVNSGTVTISNGLNAIVTWNSNPTTDNDEPVFFTTTGTLPSPLAVNTIYYRQFINSNSFHVSATIGGGNIDTTTNGSGVHTAYVLTPVVRIGPSSSSVFDSYVKDLWIDANNRTATDCLMTTGGQEGCGARNALFSGFYCNGIYIKGSQAGNLYFEDLEVSAGGGSAKDYGLRSDNSSFMLNKITTTGNGIGSTKGGIYLRNGQYCGEGWHFESSTDGLVITSDNIAGMVSLVDAGGGSDVTNLINCSANAPRFTIRGIYKWSATNSIKMSGALNLTFNDSYLPDSEALIIGQAFPDIVVTPPAGPQTGWSYENTRQRTLQVVLSGGTGVANWKIARSGGAVQIGQTAGVLILAPGDTMTLDYTTVPTIVIFQI